MNAPERWLDAPPDAPPDAAELLRGGLQLEPDGSQKDAIWATLAARLGPGSAGSDGDDGLDPSDADPAGLGRAAGAQSGASALAATAAKSILVGLLAGGVVSGGYGAWRGWFDAPPPAGVSMQLAGEAPPSVTAPGLRAPETPAMATAVRGEATPGAAPSPIERGNPRAIAPPSGAGGLPAEPARVPSTVDAPAGDGPGAFVGSASGDAVAPTPEEARRSRLREESALVGEARGALRAGDATQALALLESARTRFADGVLGQEREALTIEALARSGQGAAASARARAFLAAHPSSAHAERLQTFITP